MSAVPQLGQGLVLAGLFFAASGSVAAGFAAVRKSESGYELARKLGLGFAGSLLGANLLMIYALVTDDFSVHYVAEVGSRATPLYFKIPSLWASLNGSILFWGGVQALYTGGLVLSMGKRNREYMPWTLCVQLAISVFFALLVASIADPFEAIPNPPPDGPGPNPLLQNHWLMAIHPPALYLGYVGMSVPFAMIAGALLTGRLEAGWMAPLRRWMLIPWAFLSIGIVLGGWWSYAVLGWGGAWAWDPVENASFLPWLTGTAFVHSAMVLERRGKLRDWTLVLGMATFLLTLVGTFMTRSGVFNSVHSFTQSDIGPVFLVFIGLVLVTSVLLLALRSHALDEAATTLDNKLGGRGGDRSALDSLLSREGSILAQNAVFTVFTFVVLLGTLYPLIAEAWQERRVSVGEPYFDRWALPLGLVLVFLMGVGPALPWGASKPQQAMQRLIPPVLGGVALAGVAGILGFTGPYSLIAMFLVGFATVANLGEIITPVQQRMRARKESASTAFVTVIQRARRRFGGHIAHYGVLLAVFSLALSRGYRVEQDFALSTNETAAFQDYEITFTGARTLQESHRESRVADFAVTSAGRSIPDLSPRLNYYRTRREPIFTPAVHSTPTGDLYMSLIEVENARAVVRVIYQPYQVWLWWAAPMIALGTLIAMWPAARRRRKATPTAALEQDAA